MEDMKQAQGVPYGGTNNARQDTQTGYTATGGAAQPQPGGLYQYVPGAGFVQVQGAPQMDPSMQGAQASMGATQAAAGSADATSGMFGQGMPEDSQPKFDQNKIGQMYGVVNDIMNGEPDPSKIMSLFQDTDGDFWKGAIVGAAAGFLASNETVRNAVAGAFGSMFGNNDPEGPQVTVGDKAKEEK